MKATNTYKKIIAGSIIDSLTLTLSACGGSSGGSKPAPPRPWQKYRSAMERTGFA